MLDVTAARGRQSAQAPTSEAGQKQTSAASARISRKQTSPPTAACQCGQGDGTCCGHVIEVEGRADLPGVACAQGSAQCRGTSLVSKCT